MASTWHPINPKMENHNPWSILQFSRICNFSRTRHDNEYHKDNHHNTNNANRNYLWAIISILLFPVEVFASTTVASPNSTAQGVVNNNATMITPSGVPTNKYSQGIICSSPSLTITPYMTDAWSFNRPIETVTKQNIYDEDTGEIKYVQETPRFEKDNYNLNYGISMQFNIPLGKGQDLCQRAARWKITTPGQSFSLVESVISPGLDTITNITRTITTTQTTQIETTFGQ